MHPSVRRCRPPPHGDFSTLFRLQFHFLSLHLRTTIFLQRGISYRETSKRFSRFLHFSVIDRIEKRHLVEISSRSSDFLRSRWNNFFFPPKIPAQVTFTFYKFSDSIRVEARGGATAIISLFECYIKWNDGAKI